MTTVLNIALLGHSSVDEDFTYAFGLYRLQAYLTSLELPHRLRVLDRKVTDNEEADLALLLDEEPDLVGLSAFLWNLPRVVRLVSRLRRERPELLIVVGGPSAKGYEDLAVDDARPDLLVVGPGEVTFANIVRAQAEGNLDASLTSLGNLVSYRASVPEAHSGPATSAACLDSLPSPYLMGLVTVETKTLYVETDRGCPYSCAFCVESTAPNRVLQFSLGRIEEELRWALDRGFEHIEMCSAIFNRDSDWLEEFVELVERVDPSQRLTFSAALYSTYIDERQVGLIARLKLRSALFGLNSTNPETFKSVRRVVRLARFRERIALLSAIMRPEISLIMGLPGDTPDGFRDTLEYAATLDADVMIFRFMVLPNTLYYEHRELHGLEIDFANDNRVLCASSYTPRDFALMENIAREAGYEEGKPGQWTKRRDASLGAAMPKKTWNLLYLTIQNLDPAQTGWPGQWRFDKVLLEVCTFVQIDLRNDAGDRLDVFITGRDDEAPRFAHSRYFNLSYRESRAQTSSSAASEENPPGVREAMECVTAALLESERRVLSERRPRRPGG